MCHAFLRRPWSSLNGGTERGMTYTAHIEKIARVYFENVDDKLNLLQELVPKINNESKELVNKESTLEIFPAISKYEPKGFV